ncbi:MAG: hypothetical protein AB2L14_06830 [Candidatus Xenobiia bacterium LiM19]
MGLKLKQYYDYVGRLGGFPMQMRLATSTGLTTARAISAPDSKENIEKFKKAVRQITGKDAQLKASESP